MRQALLPFIVASVALSFALTGCGDKSIDYYYEHTKEASQVWNDCVLKKGHETLGSNKNCANAYAALKKREKVARDIQRNADEAALAKFGKSVPGK